MGGKFFSNQSSEQIIKHLSNLLEPGLYYNLSVDSLGVSFNIRESTRRPPENNSVDHKNRKHKIRSKKKGRTVKLKGVVY